jgi:hypothetical protein
MAINRKLIRGCIILAIVFFILSPMIYYCFWYTTMWLSGGSPQWQGELKNSYEKLPPKVLVNKVEVYNNIFHPKYFGPYSHIILTVLTERKDKEAVPFLLKSLKSTREGKRRDAIWRLGIIGDTRAIEPLLMIANKYKIDISYDKPYTPENIEALKALSMLKCEKVYPYAIKLATLNEDPNDFRSYGITMLEYFEKSESIPILENIAKNDPKSYIRDKARAAIEHIKKGIK